MPHAENTVTVNRPQKDVFDYLAEGTHNREWRAGVLEIEPVGDSCRLTVVHDQLPSDAPPELYGGWPMILSGLKTWLETGQTLTTPGSLMYQQH